MVNSSEGRWNWSSSGKEYFNLWVCFEGVATMDLEGKAHPVSPGTAILIRPGEPTAGAQTGEGPLVNLGMHFLVEDGADRSKLRGLSPRVVRLRQLLLVRELALYLDGRLQDLSRRDPAEISRSAEVLLEIFLGNLSLGSEDAVDARLRSLSDQFRLYPGRDWRMPDVARAAGLSVSQFCRRFRQQFGASPRDFLLRRRVERAGVMLMESTLNVSQIADQLGYEEVGYFSRQFKQKTGLSPLEFRRRSRGE
jgi:AraC family transcriptional regulator of arabinose operon